MVSESVASVEATVEKTAVAEATPDIVSKNGDLNNHKPITGAKTSSQNETIIQDPGKASASETAKLPPRPADYDYYWYQDEDGNWRNEYDDYGYVFDPNKYEGEEAEAEAKSNDVTATTVIPSASIGDDDLDKQMAVEDKRMVVATPSPTPSADRSMLKIDLSGDAARKKKLPPR